MSILSHHRTAQFPTSVEQGVKQLAKQQRSADRALHISAVVGLVGAVIVILTGCGSSAEAQFLDAQANSTGTAAVGVDPEAERLLASTALDICGLLDAGVEALEIRGELTAAGYEYEDTPDLIDYAISTYCPEYDGIDAGA